jgi:hypothetical protein
VKRIASSVSIGKDESATFAFVDIVDSIDDLEEQVRELAWMARRADTVVY